MDEAATSSRAEASWGVSAMGRVHMLHSYLAFAASQVDEAAAAAERAAALYEPLAEPTARETWDSGALHTIWFMQGRRAAPAPTRGAPGPTQARCPGPGPPPPGSRAGIQRSLWNGRLLRPGTGPPAGIPAADDGPALPRRPVPAPARPPGHRPVTAPIRSHTMSTSSGSSNDRNPVEEARRRVSPPPAPTASGPRSRSIADAIPIWPMTSVTSSPYCSGWRASAPTTPESQSFAQ